MELDGRGIPINYGDRSAAPECPTQPCELCIGYSSVWNKDGRLATSWEWCQDSNTCAATVDWERIFQNG